MIGDFRILNALGEGPLGSLHIGEHKFLKKKFVVHVFPETVEHSAIEEHVGKIAELDHLNLVHVHTVSQDGETLFMVSDYLFGAVNLSQYLTERLAEKEVLNLLKQVAYALDYIHSKDLFHGGLNLDTILVTKSGKDTPHLHLRDVGLQAIVGIERCLAQLAKKPFLQAAAFVAPEQKLGHSGIKADIYAFGVLTYFLLMGYFPEGYFVMPSGFSLDWDRVIKATMKQNPDDRIENLCDLLDRLDQHELHQVEKTIAEVIKTPTPEPALATSDVKPIIQPSVLKKFEYEEDPGAIFETKLTVTQYKPKEKEVRDLEPMRTEMVVIEGGEYMRGDTTGARDEKPRHKIQLPSFAIDIHPVTNEQFVRFLDVMGCEKDSNNNDTILLKESRIKRVGGKLSIESGFAKHPVVGVSWYGAVAYAHWVGKRLPTEAEWEIAASSGLEEYVYPYGREIERSQANFFSADTTPVMSYPPNSNGLYDMAGNVYEWCEDWYAYNYYEVSVQEPMNPKGPTQGVYRVLRGGCWKSLKDDLRCSHRHRNNPGSLNRTYGFRCAADVG